MTFLPEEEMDVKYLGSKDYGDDICPIRIMVIMICVSLISATIYTIFQQKRQTQLVLVLKWLKAPEEPLLYFSL